MQYAEDLEYCVNMQYICFIFPLGFFVNIYLNKQSVHVAYYQINPYVLDFQMLISPALLLKYLFWL